MLALLLGALLQLLVLLELLLLLLLLLLLVVLPVALLLALLLLLVEQLLLLLPASHHVPRLWQRQLVQQGTSVSEKGPVLHGIPIAAPSLQHPRLHHRDVVLHQLYE
jgi:hypothetical protein